MNNITLLFTKNMSFCVQFYGVTTGIDASEIVDFERDIFEAYLAGLENVGWHGNRNLVRLGFTAALALRHFGTMMYILSAYGKEEHAKAYADTLDYSWDSYINPLILVSNYIDGLTEEARRLINNLK